MVVLSEGVAQEHALDGEGPLAHHLLAVVDAMPLEELHDDFKASVTAGRGDKLKHAEAAAYADKNYARLAAARAARTNGKWRM